MNRRVRKENNHTRFWWLLAVLLVSLFLRYALQIDVPRLAFLPIIALISVLGSQSEILAMCMCLIPLHESVDFYYAIVICVGVYMLKCHRKIRINLTVILVIVMMAWELLHCFDVAFSPVTFVTSVVPLLALAIVMSSDPSSMEYDFIVRAMAFTTAAMCITLLGRVFYLSNFDLLHAVSNLRRLGIIQDETQKSELLAGGGVQPNSLGVIVVLVTTGLLQLRAAGRNYKMDLPLMTALLVFGTLTSSRTFLACLALMILLLILGQQGDIKQKIRFLGSIVIIILAALFLLSRFFPSLLEYFFGRFQVEDITTGRDDLMRAYHRFIMDNPDVMFFGVGLQNYGDKLVAQHRVASNLPHNSIQEIIIAWGIPGLLLIAVLIFMMLGKSRKQTARHTMLNYIPLIIILVKSMAGQLLTSGYSMLALSYAYLSLCEDLRTGDTNKSFIFRSPQTLAAFKARDDLLNKKKQ